MQHYEITLKNEKIKFYDRFALFIFLLNGAGLVIAFLYSNHELINKKNSLLLLCILLILIAFPLIIVIQKKVTHNLKAFIFASFAIMLYWVFIGYWWIGVFTIFLILLYVAAKRELKVNFSANEILYPAFPAKKIKWNDLNNLVLKDRLLTIDFKNNKIIQQAIDAKSYTVNEQEFNDFCRQQLNQ